MLDMSSDVRISATQNLLDRNDRRSRIRSRDDVSNDIARPTTAPSSLSLDECLNDPRLDEYLSLSSHYPSHGTTDRSYPGSSRPTHSDLDDEEAEALAHSRDPEQRRLYLDWLLSDRCIALVPIDRKRRPKACRKRSHHICRKFRHGSRSASRDREDILAVLALHPEKSLGVVPIEDLLIVDFDSYDDLHRFLVVTKLILRHHLVVQTPKGIHLYVRIDEHVYGPDSLKQIGKTDLRYRGNGFVAAPGMVREDGGRYSIVSGSWGDAVLNDSTARYFYSDDALDGDSLAHRVVPLADFIERMPKAEYAARKITALNRKRRRHPEGDPATELNRKEFSQSADLASMWLYCYWSGLTEHHARNLIRVIQPDSIERKLSEKTDQWLLADARRMYIRAENQRKPRPRYHAVEARDHLIEHHGEDSRIVEVFDYFIDKINRVCNPDINIGVQEIGDRFDRSKQAAKNWLDELIQAGVVSVIRGHFYTSDPEQRHKNRVRTFNVADLRVERARSCGVDSSSLSAADTVAAMEASRDEQFLASAKPIIIGLLESLGLTVTGSVAGELDQDINSRSWLDGPRSLDIHLFDRIEALDPIGDSEEWTLRVKLLRVAAEDLIAQGSLDPAILKLLHAAIRRAVLRDAIDNKKVQFFLHHDGLYLDEAIT